MFLTVSGAGEHPHIVNILLAIAILFIQLERSKVRSHHFQVGKIPDA